MRPQHRCARRGKGLPHSRRLAIMGRLHRASSPSVAATATGTNARSTHTQRRAWPPSPAPVFGGDQGMGECGRNTSQTRTPAPATCPSGPTTDSRGLSRSAVQQSTGLNLSPGTGGSQRSAIAENNVRKACGTRATLQSKRRGTAQARTGWFSIILVVIRRVVTPGALAVPLPGL